MGGGGFGGVVAWGLGGRGLGKVGGHMSGRLDAKSFDLDDPQMLRGLIWMFFDPKTSNWKILTSRGHLSGWLNAKSLDFYGPRI